MSTFRTLIAPALACVLLAACSADPQEPNDFKNGSSGSIDLGNGTSSGSSGSSGVNLGGGGDGQFDKCAEGNAKSDLLPMTLFFIIDRSGSMCETDPNNPNQRDCNDAKSKWQQSLTGLRAFFKSPDSRNITASFVTFSGVVQNACNAASYQKAEAPLTALPDTADVLGSKLASMEVNGGTPTEAALQGGIAYAKTLRPAGSDGGSFAVVFVTDGLPAGCNNNDINRSAAVCAQAQADGVPVYVVGVGNLLTNLNTLAAAAKTNNNKAFLISNGNPATVGAELNAAFETIRGATLGCKIRLPSPPAGKVLDPKKVNLVLTKGDGTKAAVPYSATCSDPKGWKYDNEQTPTRIELCGTSCISVKDDKKSSMSVVFGCGTVSTTN